MTCDDCGCECAMNAYADIDLRWRFRFLGGFYTKNRSRRFVVS